MPTILDLRQAAYDDAETYAILESEGGAPDVDEFARASYLAYKTRQDGIETGIIADAIEASRYYGHFADGYARYSQAG